MQFINANKLESGCPEEVLAEVFMLSDKYNVEELGQICKMQIFEIMDKTNVVFWLKFAHQYSFDDVKTFATDLLLKNFSEFFGNGGWREIEQDLPEVLDDIFKQVKGK